MFNSVNTSLSYCGLQIIDALVREFHSLRHRGGKIHGNFFKAENAGDMQLQCLPCFHGLSSSFSVTYFIPFGSYRLPLLPRSSSRSVYFHPLAVLPGG